MWTPDPNSNDFLSPSSLSLDYSVYHSVSLGISPLPHRSHQRVPRLHAIQLGRDRHFRLTPDALTVAYFHQSRAHHDMIVIT